MLGIRPNGVTIYRTNAIKGSTLVIMEAIDEQQELRIDKSKTYYGDIRFERPDGIIVPAKDIYLYGEVDFSNKDDIANIERFNLINPDGEWIYSNIDFDKGTFTTIDGKAKMYQTWNCLDWFKYCHILIGKPARIIVYKNPKLKK